MKRREFLKLSSLAALAGCATAPCCGENPLAVKGIRIGVQMWSVNDLWKKNPADALRRLKALGYDGVQSFGFLAMDWNELEKMLNDNGLKIVDMPFYMKTVAPDSFNKFLEFCQRFKIDFVYEPYTKFATGAEWRRHVAFFKQFAGLLDAAVGDERGRGKTCQVLEGRGEEAFALADCARHVLNRTSLFGVLADVGDELRERRRDGSCLRTLGGPLHDQSENAE